MKLDPVMRGTVQYGTVRNPYGTVRNALFPLKMSSFLNPCPSKNPANRCYLNPSNKLNNRYLQKRFLYPRNKLCFCSLTDVLASTIFPSKLQQNASQRKPMKDQVGLSKLLARVGGLTTESKIKWGFQLKPLLSSQSSLQNYFFFQNDRIGFPTLTWPSYSLLPFFFIKKFI